MILLAAIRRVATACLTMFDMRVAAQSQVGDEAYVLGYSVPRDILLEVTDIMRAGPNC